MPVDGKIGLGQNYRLAIVEALKKFGYSPLNWRTRAMDRISWRHQLNSQGQTRGSGDEYYDCSKNEVESVHSYRSEAYDEQSWDDDPMQLVRVE
jgi:hypothetical protein